ncbi:hypothetical protein [Caulobacter segnis]|uniref:Uncharacterized protein n=1 Tax=Caulobacter segnis TaxID=88688 RepID=A0A2W5V3A3_9CAUL|nr:hypothetical protein [Caulobacter segnis]PZR33227.1 MAG: hypothetical protein DI526_14115 [Caulobacter segnis]
MSRPSNDDAPPFLSDDAAFLVAEILEEYAPSTPDDYARLAAEAERRPETFEGGPDIAQAVTAELRRRGRALADAGG